MKQVLAIARAARFSPNSVEKDLAILTAVADRLRQQGCHVDLVSEEALADTAGSSTAQQAHPDLVVTMGRLPATLQWLKSLSARVVNRPEGVERCARSVLTNIMKQEGMPLPPAEGEAGYWLKRGDAAAQQRGDVVYAATQAELNRRISEFQSRGISDYVVSAHVAGDLVKFYGVRGSGFFRYFYPTDDGDTKFGDEALNGTAQHYQFPAIDLHQASERLAAAVGVDVYGGDCIVQPDGSFCLIDFNDWPSFSRCRDEAARAIAALVTN